MNYTLNQLFWDGFMAHFSMSVKWNIYGKRKCGEGWNA